MEGKQKIINATSIILGIATCGLTGIMYAGKCVAYKKALAAAQYNAQIAEAQKGMVEAIHQSAINSLKTGNPLFDYNEYGSSIFPSMKGKFSTFAANHPELANKILLRVQSHSNADVLDKYAQERGFSGYNEYVQWANESYAHLFNADGTLSSTASMQDLDSYYYTFVDMYNYLGDEAIQFYADDILKAGIDPSVLQGAQIIETSTTDAAGNVVSSWTVGLTTDAMGAVNATSNLDAGELVGAIGIAAFAGCGAYFVSKSILNHFGSRNREKPIAIAQYSIIDETKDDFDKQNSASENALNAGRSASIKLPLIGSSESQSKSNESQSK